MSARERLIDMLMSVCSDSDPAALADRIIAAGWHDGPALPEPGSPEEAEAERAIEVELWDVTDGGMCPVSNETLARAALRALHPQEPSDAE